MFGEIDFKVIHIPGHTVGHIAFYSKKANIVFTGDTFSPWGAEEFLRELLNKCFNL